MCSIMDKTITALVEAEDVGLLVPVWEGQTWPVRYWRLPDEKSRSADSVVAPEAPNRAEDILDEVCKAVVAPASTHPHRQNVLGIIPSP